MEKNKRYKTLNFHMISKSKEDEELFFFFRQLTEAKGLKMSLFVKKLIRDWVNQEMEKNHKVLDLSSMKIPPNFDRNGASFSDVVEISREEEDLNKKLDEFQNKF